MKLNPNQIDYLAFRLLKHLEKAEAVAARDFDQAHRALIDIISDDFAVEDALNVDVRKILEAFEGQMQKEGVQYHEMFKKVKAKLKLMEDADRALSERALELYRTIKPLLPNLPYSVIHGEYFGKKLLIPLPAAPSSGSGVPPFPSLNGIRYRS